MVLLWLLLAAAGDVGFLVSAMSLLLLPSLERGTVHLAMALQGVPVQAPIRTDSERWVFLLVASVLAIAVSCVQLWRGSRAAHRESRTERAFEDWGSDDLRRAA